MSGETTLPPVDVERRSALTPPSASAAARWARRLFVPVVTLALVLLGGQWVASHLDLDLMTVAQSDRLTFQASESAQNARLSDAEMTLANAVLDRDRAADTGKSQLLFLGNSQTMAIMDRKAGELTTPQWLELLLARRNVPAQVRLGSLPNLTSDEALVTLISRVEASPRQADVLVEALVLEEFRGVGVREEVAAVAKRPEVTAALRQLLAENPDLPAARQALEELLGPEKREPAAHGVSGPSMGAAASPAAAAAADRRGAWTDRTDQRLATVADRVPLIAKREKVTAYMAVQYMALRNKLLHITSSSPRPVPEPMYRASTELTELLLRYAKQKGIAVVLYLAPIRPVQPNPNLKSDVERFRRELPPLAAKYGATCLDFIDAVPESLWTNYPDSDAAVAGQRDFAHFTGDAHKLVAETLLPTIEQVIVRSKPAGVR